MPHTTCSRKGRDRIAEEKIIKAVIGITGGITFLLLIPVLALFGLFIAGLFAFLF